VAIVGVHAVQGGILGTGDTLTPDKMTFMIFMWRPPQPVEEIDIRKPTLVYDVPREG
jgi:hypothetical protein